MRVPTKLLLLLAMVAPMFAADPPGFMVWKGSDLKHKAASEELSKAAGYQALLVHRENDGEVELHESQTELLVIETGVATLVVGDEIHGAFIKGGERKELVEGDVVHIPSNLPYQILAVAGQSVTYLAFRRRADSDDDAAAPAPINPAGKKPDLGIDLGSGFRACLPSDHSPAGTVVDGYRKVIGKTFMGRSCLWAREQPEDAATDSAKPKQKPQLGTDMGDGYRSCVPGDDSPSGTIVDGYRKVSHASPFGLSCAWEKIK